MALSDPWYPCTAFKSDRYMVTDCSCDLDFLAVIQQYENVLANSSQMHSLHYIINGKVGNNECYIKPYQMYEEKNLYNLKIIKVIRLQRSGVDTIKYHT